VSRLVSNGNGRLLDHADETARSESRPWTWLFPFRVFSYSQDCVIFAYSDIFASFAVQTAGSRSTNLPEF
jgi:hypothetical protein